MQAHCDVCGKDAAHVCMQCEQAIYCSEKCQSIDFPVHEKICQHVNEMDISNVAADIQLLSQNNIMIQ